MVYNRIHEMRTRFEVLWRDAEIAQTTWTRHFDDRIGFSPVEELRLTVTP